MKRTSCSTLWAMFQNHRWKQRCSFGLGLGAHCLAQLDKKLGNFQSGEVWLGAALEELEV